MVASPSTGTTDAVTGHYTDNAAFFWTARSEMLPSTRPFQPRYYVVTATGDRVARSSSKTIASDLTYSFDRRQPADQPHTINVLDLPAVPIDVPV
jgi:hypothetical protein